MQFVALQIQHKSRIYICLNDGGCSESYKWLGRLRVKEYYLAQVEQPLVVPAVARAELLPAVPVAPTEPVRFTKRARPKVTDRYSANPWWSL